MPEQDVIIEETNETMVLACNLWLKFEVETFFADCRMALLNEGQRQC